MARLGALGLCAAGASLSLAQQGCACAPGRAHGGNPPRRTARGARWFEISLAQWSLHRALQSGALEHLDFPLAARRDYDIHAVEFVSTFFQEKQSDSYNAALKQRCDDLGVRSLLIMVDGEGALGDPDPAMRAQAIDNHRRWLDAAKALGCHSIRVNAESRGGWEEQQALVSDGLRRLCDFADPLGLGVIIENHWGLSSNGAWLDAVMRRVDHPRIGTLPDFGNFDPKEYDRYRGVEEMLPWARAVSAKSYDFDPSTGEEMRFDYRRLLASVRRSGYRGHIGIEYEGDQLSEPEGIRATRRLLKRLREELSTEIRT